MNLRHVEEGSLGKRKERLVGNGMEAGKVTDIGSEILRG